MIHRFAHRLFAFAICVAVAASTPNTSDAGGFLKEKVYKVEVEYWYWPADIYYWTSLTETTSEREARLILAILTVGKEGGYLDLLVASDDRHKPVNVRMTCYERPIQILEIPWSNEAELQEKKLIGQPPLKLLE